MRKLLSMRLVERGAVGTEEAGEEVMETVAGDQTAGQ